MVGRGKTLPITKVHCATCLMVWLSNDDGEEAVVVDLGRPSGVCVVARVSSLAGIDSSHKRFPGTAVPGFRISPLRDWSASNPTFCLPVELRHRLLRDLNRYATPAPALKRWAKVERPSGAGFSVSWIPHIRLADSGHRDRHVAASGYIKNGRPVAKLVFGF